jgi:hypothetical protein
MGDYDKLNEQPVAPASEIDFVCYTDDPKLTSSTWDVRVIEPPLLGDPVRSCRILKIRGHEDLEQYDETLWIDNSVVLQSDPAGLLDDWLEGFDFALPWHGFRGTVASEFDAVAATVKDNSARVFEQLEVYEREAPDVLAAETLWTGILARRRSDLVVSAMTTWLDHVLRYSRRDQLSVQYAIQKSGVTPRVVEIDNFESRWHRWPVRTDIPAEPELANGLHYPPSTEIARLHADIDDLTLRLVRAVTEREAEVQRAEVARRDADAARAALDLKLAELLASRTWRVGAAVSAVAQPLLRAVRRVTRRT